MNVSRKPSIGLFVEGANAVDQRGHDRLHDLWNELARRVRGQDFQVGVYGFSKAQLVALEHGPHEKHSREPLDIFIARMHARDRFDVAIVAFDAIPSNQCVRDPCLRSEVGFVLDRFVGRGHLPEPFLREASRLIAHYANSARIERPPGRPPRGPLDILFMDPMFEGLLVSDEGAVLRALGLGKRPKDWPSFTSSSKHPDTHVLTPAVDYYASKGVRGKVRGDFRANKHAWALEIVRAASKSSRLWKHPIAARLATLIS